MPSLGERVFGDCETLGDRMLVAAEMLCLVVIVSAFIAGTVVNFTFPRSKAPNGCHFADALIVYVECPQQWLGTLLSWAWWWTWGIHWQILFLPFSLMTLTPELVTIWLAARFVRRLVV